MAQEGQRFWPFCLFQGSHCALARVPTRLRARGRVRSTTSCTHADSPFSKLAVEGHGDFVLVPSPLIKGVTGVEGWAVQMQANSRLCVAYVLHTVQANGVYTSKGTKWEGMLVGRSNEVSTARKKCFLYCNSWVNRHTHTSVGNK